MKWSGVEENGNTQVKTVIKEMYLVTSQSMEKKNHQQNQFCMRFVPRVVAVRSCPRCSIQSTLLMLAGPKACY